MGLRLRGHVGVRVYVTPVAPKLMRMPHNPAQNIDFAIAAAEQMGLLTFHKTLHSGCV